MGIMDTAIKRACELAGGQAALARGIGIRPPSINEWISSGRPVPHERCPDIERVTEGKVACEELRPDLTWVRIPDPDWPHPDGRPLVDYAAKKEAA